MLQTFQSTDQDWEQISKELGISVTIAQDSLGEDALLATSQMGMASDLIKASNGNRTKKSEELGVAGVNDMKSFLHDETYMYGRYGAKYRPQIVPTRVLRAIARTPMVGACNTLRQTQVAPYCDVAEDEDRPGFDIRMRDKDAKPSPKDLDEMKRLRDWVIYAGRTDFDGWQQREYGLKDTMRIVASELMTLNVAALEIINDVENHPAYFKIIDGSTIRRVGQYGFTGDKNDINPRYTVYETSKTIERLNSSRINMIPDEKDIRFVQEINNTFVAAYAWKDLVFHVRNAEVDQLFAGYPISPLEKAITAIKGFLNSILYNSNAFDRSSIPKMGLNFEDKQPNKQEARRLQNEWRANFRGPNGAFNMPILYGKVSTIDFMKSARDMEYSQYLQMMGALIAANLSVDTEELGLHFQGAKAVLQENPESRMANSRSRGLLDILGEGESIINKIFMRFKHTSHDGQPIYKKYRAIFTGIDPKDRELHMKLKTEEMGAFGTPDEIRRRDDKKPMHEMAQELGVEDQAFLDALKIAGAMPANQQISQTVQALMQQQQQGAEEGMPGMEGGEGEDFDSMIEDQFAEAFKAKDESARARILLS